jgi:hypothetical protein
MKKSKKEEFIIKANFRHNNKYDYSKTYYFNASTKVIVICPIHGEFETIPNSHINSGYGCRKCADDYLRYDTKKFISQMVF